MEFVTALAAAADIPFTGSTFRTDGSRSHKPLRDVSNAGSDTKETPGTIVEELKPERKFMRRVVTVLVIIGVLLAFGRALRGSPPARKRTRKRFRPHLPLRNWKPVYPPSTTPEESTKWVIRPPYERHRNGCSWRRTGRRFVSGYSCRSAISNLYRITFRKRKSPINSTPEETIHPL